MNIWAIQAFSVLAAAHKFITLPAAPVNRPKLLGTSP
jgi:hypothetical protein